jgi:hypothetical protein
MMLKPWSATLLIAPVGVIAALAGCLSGDEPLFGAVPEPSPAGSSDRSSNTLEATPPNADAARGASFGTEVPPQLSLEPPAADSNSGQAGMEGAESSPEVDPSLALALAACDADGLLLCDTFEASAPGAFPALDAWLRELPGCGSHVVDASDISRSGAQMLRADAGGYPECMLHADISGETEIHVRSWIRLDPAVLDAEQYVSLFELGPGERRDDPELRVGLRPASGSLCNGVPGVDVSIGGVAGGPDTQCSGVELVAERWYCFQARLSRQGGGLDFSLQVDGELAASRSYPSLDAGWNTGTLFFKLGQATYGGNAAGSIWHDDVALGRSALDCGPLSP